MLKMFLHNVRMPDLHVCQFLHGIGIMYGSVRTGFYSGAATTLQKLLSTNANKI